jgi:hypothetical protein
MDIKNLLAVLKFGTLFSSGFGSEFGLTPGQTRRIRETNSKGKGAEECGSNLMR